jgi:hypothetical protein
MLWRLNDWGSRSSLKEHHFTVNFKSLFPTFQNSKDELETKSCEKKRFSFMADSFDLSRVSTCRDFNQLAFILTLTFLPSKTTSSFMLWSRRAFNNYSIFIHSTQHATGFNHCTAFETNLILSVANSASELGLV